MKKVLVLLAALVLLFGALSSCTVPKSELEKAEAALENGAYNVTMKMSFESSNEDLNELFALMNFEIPMTVDGKNLAMDLSTEMMSLPVGVKAILVDKVLYYTVDMFGESHKFKATLTEEQYREFMAESNAEMKIKPEDFSEKIEDTRDGKKHIVCEKISSEALKELNDMMKESLEGIGADVSVGDISYGVVLNDGKYESMALSCTVSVTVEGETVSVTFNMSAEYSYDNVQRVTAPADADEYEEMGASDFLE